MRKLVQHNLNVTERHNYEKTRGSHEPVSLTPYNLFKRIYLIYSF
jgi:hypothetical protein